MKNDLITDTRLKQQIFNKKIVRFKFWVESQKSANQIILCLPLKMRLEKKQRHAPNRNK